MDCLVRETDEERTADKACARRECGRNGGTVDARTVGEGEEGSDTVRDNNDRDEEEEDLFRK